MVVETGEFRVGLLVERVFGVLTFPEDGRLPPSPGGVQGSLDEEALQACLLGRYSMPSGDWDVLDVGAVLHKRGFLEVAA